MDKMLKTVGFVFAAWLSMTSISAAEQKCDIKQKVSAWNNKAPSNSRETVSTILRGYKDLQANITTYREELFGGQAAKDAYIKKVSEDGRSFRHTIANFVAEADISAGISDPKCYICLVRRTWASASKIGEKCKSVMKILRTWGGVNDKLDQLPELDKCTRVDSSNGEISRQDLQDPKLNLAFWDKMQDTIRILDDQVTAWQAANSLDNNQSTVSGLLDIYIGQYTTLKTQHDGHTRNDKLPSDMGPPGAAGLESICPGYSTWIQTGK